MRSAGTGSAITTGGRNTRLWRRAAVLVMITVLSVLLAGCEEKVTAQSLAKKTSENLAKVRSLNCRQQMDVGASIEISGINAELNAEVLMDSDLIKEPVAAEVNIDLTVSVLGMSQTFSAVSYAEQEGENVVTYTSSEGSPYVKETVKAEDYSSLTYTDTTIFDRIADGSLPAELREGTEELPAGETYVIDTVLKGDLLKGMMGASFPEYGELGIDEDSIDWENTEVPTVIYILKEEKLPARITMDCKQLGDQLFDAALKGGDPEVSALLEGIGVTTSGFFVTADYSDYDAIGSIDIPEEARSAVEKE